MEPVLYLTLWFSSVLFCFLSKDSLVMAVYGISLEEQPSTCLGLCRVKNQWKDRECSNVRTQLWFLFVFVCFPLKYISWFLPSWKYLHFSSICWGVFLFHWSHTVHLKSLVLFWWFFCLFVFVPSVFCQAGQKCLCLSFSFWYWNPQISYGNDLVKREHGGRSREPSFWRACACAFCSTAQNEKTRLVNL